VAIGQACFVLQAADKLGQSSRTVKHARHAPAWRCERLFSDKHEANEASVHIAEISQVAFYYTMEIRDTPPKYFHLVKGIHWMEGQDLEDYTGL